MPLKKTVAMERRIDLASLFCLIARHGPAVLMTLAVLGLSLAGYVILRNMREKRRRRKAVAEASSPHGGHGHGHPALSLEGEEQQSCAGEDISRRGSTDASDEENAYDSYFRRCRADHQRNPYKDKLTDRDTGIKAVPYSFFWHRHSPKATESHAGEARFSYERNFSHASTEGVAEEIGGATKPGLINDVGSEEKEKVIEADSSEDITSTAEDVSEEEFVREEETLQFTFNSQPSQNGDKENMEETDLQQQEHELENGITPVLKQDEISSAPYIKDQEVASDQAVTSLDFDQQTDIHCNDNTVSSTLSVEAMEEDLVKANQNETCKNLSSNGQQQSEPPMSTALETDIDQNGLSPHELLHFKTDMDNSSNQKEVGEMDYPQKTSDDANNLDLDTALRSVDVSVAEGKNLDHQETMQQVETEPSLLSEDTSSVQNQQSQEILPKAYTDCFSDQKDNICEENDLNIENEEQSLHVDFKHEECSVHPPAPQSQVFEVLGEETGPSGLTADVTEEISTVTVMTVQANNEKPLEGNLDLDTETMLPPALPSQTSENESSQTCQKEECMDTTNISAATRDKIESMVEQMVAEVYKDVTHSVLEAEPMELDESKSSNHTPDTDGNFTCDKVNDREVINNNNNNNKNSCVKVEDAVQVLAANDASETKCQNATFNGEIMPVTKTVPNPQDAKHSEESVEHLVMVKNVENKISVREDEHLVQQATMEVSQLEQTSSEQAVELQAQSVLDINATVHDNLAKEQIVEVVKQEIDTEDVSSKMATQMQAEVTASCPDVCSFEKAEEQKRIQSDIDGKDLDIVTTTSQFEQQGEQKESEVVLDVDESLSNKSELENVLLEKEIPSSIETKVLEITATPNEVQSELKESEVCLDFDSGLSNKTETEVGNVLLDKEEAMQEIPSSIETEVLENTATLNVAQGEQKESEFLSNTGDNIPNTTVKSSKVVIVCRTSEACISTIEMSDSEDCVDDETSHLDLTSYKSSSFQDTDIGRNPVNEEACTDLVGSSCDTLAAQTEIVEMTTEFDLTSHVTLDITQESSAFTESAEQSEQKDNGTSSPSLESGISSMMVSPEEESCKVIGQDATTCQVCAGESISSIATTDEAMVTRETEPKTSNLNEISAFEEISDELSMTNEDSFGSEIEDCYNKATEELMMRMVDNIKVTSEDMTKETVKKVEKEQACAGSKQNGEKVDSEKTDISIMEATMDHNEWITEGNYQVLPWMTTFSKDSTNTDLKDAVESKPEPQASTSEESVENAKKVLAVQPMPQNVNITFRIHYVTLSPYHTVAVTGDQPELGAWKSVIPLEKTKDGYWTCVASLPAETHVEWKFVVLEKGEVCRWEECGNRLLYTGYGDDLLVHKWWGFL